MGLTIAVYTISLNEAQFVDRWAATTEAADIRLVADTGSTDGTPSSLIAAGVTVANIAVKPWRFDDARNAALALLPDADVVISLDMDETLAPNWRADLEAAWTPGTTRLNYGYVWAFKDDKPDVVFFSDKIAGRHTHRWRAPVHEILVPTVPEVVSRCETILIEHRPDPLKPRSQYLGLLELAVAEAPHDDRSLHYLAREYFFHAAYREAIERFHRHLASPNATWKPERAASMRYLGRCYAAWQDWNTAAEWFASAVEEDASRDSLIEAAKHLLLRNEYAAVIEHCKKALAAPPAAHYLTDRYAQAEGAHDLMAVAYHYLGDSNAAVHHARQAVHLNPDDARLQANLTFIAGSST
jgi:glycosyltransferase involved in cell wall biosynthesis